MPTGTWWSETIRGVTNLNNRMSWLSVIAYVGYLAAVLTLFLRHSPSAAAAPAQPARRAEAVPQDAVAQPAVTVAAQAMPVAVGAPSSSSSSSSSSSAAAIGGSGGGDATSPRARRWLIAAAAVLIAVPVVGAAAWVAVDHQPTVSTVAGHAVTVTDTSCADDWVDPATGTTVYSVSNQSSHAVDVEIVLTASQAVVAEIEVLGPGTTRDLPAALGGSAYHWTCVYAGAATTISASRTAVAASAVAASGGGGSGGGVAGGAVAAALAPVTTAELKPALIGYRAYVAQQLNLLAGQLEVLHKDVTIGNRPAAQRDWLTAHLTYHRIGAAYDAFGDAGDAVDGLANGLPQRTADAGFVGFHRIEMELWTGQPLSTTAAYTGALVAAVEALHAKLPSFTFDPNDVTIRAHEILEDTVRFVLTGESDYGSGSGYATAQADLAGDRVLVGLLAPLLSAREENLLTHIHQAMDILQGALTAAIKGGSSVAAAPLRVRQSVDAATSQLAETLAPIPDLLEVRAR